RQLAAGDVFFACAGHAGDGRDYIAQAVQAGAAAVIVQASGDRDTAAGVAVPVLSVADLPALMGEVGHHWYGRPSEAMSVVAVTGTNGKTSCVQWLAAALNAEGTPCGTIGTLGVTLPDG